MRIRTNENINQNCVVYVKIDQIPDVNVNFH